MNERTYFLVTAIIFTVVAVIHVLRIAFGWEAEIAGAGVPMWASWVAVAVLAVVAFLGFRFYRRTR